MNMTTEEMTAGRIEAAYQQARGALFAERDAGGFWVGELSTSALSTATAVMALHLMRQNDAHRVDHADLDRLVRGGLDWLVAHQNDDGGWGDTTKSISNISTTMLCRSAFHLTRQAHPADEASSQARRVALARGEDWLFTRFGNTPEQLAEAVRARYGKDRTFAVPILTTCALAGLVSWREVPPLPFELACLPQSWFRFVRLHVVSYALPALIAIGRCIYEHNKPWNPLSRISRWLARGGSMRVLSMIQPSSGGFLEATPLTSFVVLSLASSGLAGHGVAQLGTEFLMRSVRPDGSWPIDTNLSTWVTTLSINALAAADDLAVLDRQPELRRWLLEQQYHEPHPYTGADPGAWAWTPLPGGVPDADDTPGALLALTHLEDSDKGTNSSLATGARWLLDLQNSDGGWPTFCRGWGHLPFDRSGCDLTAHVLRAFHSLRSTLDFEDNSLVSTLSDRRLQAALESGLAYLQKTQRSDGSWLPLWFGNQHCHDDENPTYGTARVLAAYRDLQRCGDEPARRGLSWLLQNQNSDGGWGGARGTPSSIEETALALEVLAGWPVAARDEARILSEAVNKATNWLVEQVEAGQLADPCPIGFYFAKLWYFEKLYPIIFTVAALGRARRWLPPKGLT